MIRALVNAVASARLAIGMLVFSVVWSIAATAVPQGAEVFPQIAAWDAAHPAAAWAIGLLGLHQAFTAWPFIVCMSVLGASTIICSWRRGRAALVRVRTLADARATSVDELAASHDVAITVDATLSGREALDVAARTLSGLGVDTKERGGVIRAVSPAWSVWGSAIFHWSLVSLMLIVLVGNLQRSDGMMAVAVGETKADAPASYGVLSVGSLYPKESMQRSFRVDMLDPDMELDGMELGPVPTVSVLDGSGGVLKQQLVYPNNMLHLGSLKIHCPAVGLAANVSLLDVSGEVVGSTYAYIDFSQEASGGTVPVERLVGTTPTGQAAMQVGVTVPLDRLGSGYDEWLPKDPRAEITIYDPTGASPLAVREVRPGESVELPGGGWLRMNSLDWYARLAVVDDWTTPYLYAAMVIALVGLGISLLARQQLVLAAVVQGESGTELALRLQLWRNVPTTRREIETELRAALSGKPAIAAADEDAENYGPGESRHNKLEADYCEEGDS